MEDSWDTAVRIKWWVFFYLHVIYWFPGWLMKHTMSHEIKEAVAGSVLHSRTSSSSKAASGFEKRSFTHSLWIRPLQQLTTCNCTCWVHDPVRTLLKQLHTLQQFSAWNSNFQAPLRLLSVLKNCVRRGNWSIPTKLHFVRSTRTCGVMQHHSFCRMVIFSLCCASLSD